MQRYYYLARWERALCVPILIAQPFTLAANLLFGPYGARNHFRHFRVICGEAVRGLFTGRVPW